MHFFFYHFFLLLRSQETQFHHTKHSNSNSFHFYCISNHKNHNFTPFFFYLLFSNITKFKLISKIQKNTKLHKFTQNAHFTPISFPSPQFVHLELSSHITPHHYPTHHHSPPKIIKKSPKNSFFFAKF